MSRWRSLLFPLSLALILGGLSAWLGRISEVVVEEVKLNPDEPQYTMLRIQGKTFDETGSLKESLLSPKVWQLPDGKNVFFSEPTLQVFDKNTPQYTVNSAIARYELASKKVFFEDKVLLDKIADNKEPATHIQTEQLEVDTQTKIARTDALIEYRYGLSKAQAQGMIYDYPNGQLNLPKKVKAVIYDWQ